MGASTMVRRSRARVRVVVMAQGDNRSLRRNTLERRIEHRVRLSPANACSEPLPVVRLGDRPFLAIGRANGDIHVAGYCRPHPLRANGPMDMQVAIELEGSRSHGEVVAWLDDHGPSKALVECPAVSCAGHIDEGNRQGEHEQKHS